MFRVVWLQPALNELAEIWMRVDSGRRLAVNAAAQAIDAELLTDPQNAGESRPGGRRVLFHAPLGATFEIRTAGVVRVLHVWDYWPRG